LTGLHRIDRILVVAEFPTPDNQHLISKMIQPTLTGGRVRCADPIRARRPRSQEGVTFATPVSAPSLRSLLGITVVPC
ncbi:MAG: hypothetical protein, partial [Olavius algarvensis Gamma 1 endosymbiont]